MKMWDKDEKLTGIWEQDPGIVTALANNVCAKAHQLISKN